MKVTNIARDERLNFVVTLTPNWLEKLFGVKPKTVRYRDAGSTYVFGGQTAYYMEDGTKTTNNDYVSEEIDKFRRKF